LKSVCEALRTSEDEPLLGSLLLRQAFFLACLETFGEGGKAVGMAEEGLTKLARHQKRGIRRETLILAHLCSGVIYWFVGEPQRMKEAAQQVSTMPRRRTTHLLYVYHVLVGKGGVQAG